MSFSWMRVWRVGPVVLSLVACGSDQGASHDGVTCGEGTVLKDDKCIPQCGAGTVFEDGQCVVGGAAGNASQGGGANQAGNGGSGDAEAGSAGESEADAGSAGEHENHGGSAGFGFSGSGGTAGSNLGGAGTGGGSSAGSAGIGGSNPGGAGSGGSGGSGAAGGAGAGPNGRPQWLVIYQATEGLSAYDLKAFPAAGATTIEAGNTIRGNSISPDGRWLLYAKGYDVYCRDLTGAVPGSPILVATSVPSSVGSSNLTWSADSKTAAVVAWTVPGTGVLEVFDPTRPAPVLRVLSSATNTLSWAPAGDRIMYADAGGTHVRRVQSGVPSPDLVIDINQFGGGFIWAPDGQAVALSPSNKVTWTDLTQATPVAVTLSTPSVPNPTVLGKAFGADSASVFYFGTQIRDGARDLFKVTVKPTIGAPVRVSTGLSATATVNGFSQSPDGKWVVYTVADSATSSSPTYWAVDVSGATPGTPLQIAAVPTSNAVWVPNGSGKFLSSYNGGISVVDVRNGTANLLPGVVGSPSFLLSPVGAMVAYSNDVHVYVRDLDHADAPIGDIALLSTNGNNTRSWSPDGKFIATIEPNNQLRLVRLEGTLPSTAVPVTTGSYPNLTWQPLGN